MSVKIYSGYRIPLNGTSVFSVARDVRAMMQPVMKNALHRRYVSNAINIYQAQELTSKGLLKDSRMSSRTAYASAVKALEDFEKESFRFSLFLFSDPQDRTSEYVYLITLTNPLWEKAFVDHFTASHGLEEYGYWNNSDQPEEVSDEDWAIRAQVWERTGVLDMPLNECGLKVEMFDSDWYKIEAIEVMWNHRRKDVAFKMQSLCEEITGQEDFLNNAVRLLAYRIKTQRAEASLMTEASSGIEEEVRAIISVPVWKDLISV